MDIDTSKLHLQHALFLPFIFPTLQMHIFVSPVVEGGSSVRQVVSKQCTLVENKQDLTIAVMINEIVYGTGSSAAHYFCCDPLRPLSSSCSESLLLLESLLLDVADASSPMTARCAAVLARSGRCASSAASHLADILRRPCVCVCERAHVVQYKAHTQRSRDQENNMTTKSNKKT